jgi:hypothetical protein
LSSSEFRSSSVAMTQGDFRQVARKRYLLGKWK